MPTIGTITKSTQVSGKFVKNVQSAALDAADEETAAMSGAGFKSHDVILTPTSTTDTNNVDVILWGSVDGGTTYFQAATANYGTAEAGIPQKISYDGYLDFYKIELAVIAAGSPTVNNIHAISYDQYGVA